jgi:hypothetical protein
MAIVVRFDVSGMNTAKYEEALRRLDAAGAAAPAGRLHHVAFGAPESIQVIDVYDSVEALESFGKILGPILAELGIQATPAVEPAYNIVRA